MQVFLLWHVHELDADQDNEKLIGVYSTQQLAEAALARTRVLAGFCDLPEGFVIEPYSLDEDHWREGYVAINPGES